jgi:hypothetical protein
MFSSGLTLIFWREFGAGSGGGERLRITVMAAHDDRHRCLKIIVREPPAPFKL